MWSLAAARPRPTSAWANPRSRRWPCKPMARSSRSARPAAVARNSPWHASIANGTLDPGFGTAGEVTTLLGSSANSAAREVAIQADGKILVAGFAGPGGSQEFALARYNPNGSLDATFGDPVNPIGPQPPQPTRSGSVLTNPRQCLGHQRRRGARRQDHCCRLGAAQPLQQRLGLRPGALQGRRQ